LRVGLCCELIIPWEVWTIFHDLPGPMWLTLYVLDYVFGVETDEDNAISDFTPNLQELLEWLKERSNVLLRCQRTLPY